MSNTFTKQQLQDMDSYRFLFKRYPWELTITTRIPNSISTHEANEQLVQQIFVPIAAHLKQKIAAVTVVVPATTTEKGYQPAHMHSLVLSFEGDLESKIIEIQGTSQGR